MKASLINDQELIRLYLEGNEACLEMLIKRHKRKVFTAIIMIVHDRYIAEDIFQETFIKVVKTLKGGKYNEEGKFLPWVMRIARNLSIDYFRRSKRMPKITTSDGEDVFRTIQIVEENREDKMIRMQKEQTIRDLIKLLPEEQREIIILRHYAELSFKEISEITQVSINTALGRMRYALNNLRKLISEKSLSLQ
jgi:RNA polymerase sigma-70 factor (ECF subfamily)